MRNVLLPAASSLLAGGDGLGITGGSLSCFLLFVGCFLQGINFTMKFRKTAAYRSCRSRSDLTDRIHAGPRSRGSSEQPVGLQPLDAPAAAAAAGMEGTPVRLSQGCGGGEGANTTQHKEHTHTHTRSGKKGT